MNKHDSCAILLAVTIWFSPRGGGGHLTQVFGYGTGTEGLKP